MKKIVLILSIFLSVSLTANAYVDSQYLKTEQFLVNVGYSKEMKNMVEITSEDPYREPYQEGKDPRDIARRVYHYIVPGQNGDLDFYNHSGSFNGWSWKDY